MSSKKLKGKISLTVSGIGYFSNEKLKEDVKIEPGFLNTALNGDKVEIILFPEEKNEPLKGEVINILERNKTRFVGTIDKKGKNYSFLIPDDNKMYTDIFIPNTDEDIRNGHKALVEMINWKKQKESPEGVIIRMLGKKGSEKVEREAIVLESGMESDFKKEVKEEAKKIKKKSDGMKKAVLKDRRDMRQVKTFTIDPETAKDYDDAISFKKISDDTYEIGVHIADVSFYVKEGTLMDQAAKSRGFSIYMVGETIPMLPEVISNDLCSLNPNEEKLAFSIVFKIDKRGNVKEKWIGETVIKSDKRYTYKEAMKEIERGDETLSILNNLAKTMNKERTERGSLKFKSDEVSFEMDKDGNVIDIKKKEPLETHALIEEFMLLANKHVAREFYKDPFVFRIHEEPDPDVIKKLKLFLSGLGYDINLNEKATSQKLNSLINKIEGEDVEFLVGNIILRSMTKAYYSTKNKGHFGLAFKKYTHFTSPIRRYADLTVHRIIKKKQKNKKLKGSSYYEEIAASVSENELRAQDAERESIAYKKCQYMMKKVGQKRDVIISGITEWGIYVRDLDSFAEGMISLRSLDDDYYILDKENYRLMGRNKKKKFSLGDKMKAKIEKVDLETRSIDFTL